MKILSLETSTKNFSLAVSCDQKILASRHFKLTKVLSSSIIPAIDGILKKSGLALKDLDGFAVGLGPGSFTSLRVGLSTVKGLSFVTGKPIVGISSLDVLAMNAPVEAGASICVIGDARRNLVYSCVYRRTEKGLERVNEYSLTGMEEVLKKIKEPTFFSGDGIPLYREIIREHLRGVIASDPVPDGTGERSNLLKSKKIASSLKNTPRNDTQSELIDFLFAKEKDWYPKASHLAKLAHPRFLRKKFDPVDKIVPLYLYPEDCQVVPRNS